MKQEILNNIKTVILASVLAVVALSASLALGNVNWNNPPCPPPECNTDTPLNIGGGTQIKTGPLTLHHLFTPDLTLTNSDGSVTGILDGSILVADGNNTGRVKWQNPTEATTGYDIECLPYTASIGDRCCRLNINTGEVICKEASSDPDGFDISPLYGTTITSWINTNTVFTSSSSGRYELMMFDVQPGTRYVMICRNNVSSGNMQCKHGALSAGLGHSIAGPWTNTNNVPF